MTRRFLQSILVVACFFGMFYVARMQPKMYHKVVYIGFNLAEMRPVIAKEETEEVLYPETYLAKNANEYGLLVGKDGNIMSPSELQTILEGQRGIMNNPDKFIQDTIQIYSESFEDWMWMDVSGEPASLKIFISKDGELQEAYFNSLTILNEKGGEWLR